MTAKYIVYVSMDHHWENGATQIKRLSYTIEVSRKARAEAIRDVQKQAFPDATVVLEEILTATTRQALPPSEAAQ